MLNKLCKVFLAFTLLAFAVAMPATVLAEETSGSISTEEITQIEGSSSSSTSGSSTTVGTMSESSFGLTSTSEGVLSSVEIGDSVTLDEVGEKIIDKLWDGANLIQRGAMVISVIFFIVGAIMIGYGAISRRASTLPGIMTCIASIACFTLAIYAPQIISAVSQFLVE